ncbi:uncharacterized protein Z518_10775 [Rhinocladiella mackenziei CBS 650.93]|uniref:Cytochrome P450 monooxygenase n=1 Tax=Rhinocladiella mackenziei CBS 650.93 TaxID=1442369 RepID=A0A0D2GN90_9EURO|nr:uncharacterized protein Z518_10775 [Rhinocladiella mackenziei CBS 650.93]KIW99847.1 hypothetical protein Z518_10775 [Rhinocladiella mackenziei CBS 650.93]
MDRDPETWLDESLKISSYLLVAGLLSVILLCFYRICLHPLAQFPGPFISKITDWSIVFQAASGDRHIETWTEHEKYGSIVRIGPNTLSFNTVTALKTIYSSRKANVQKANWYRTIDAGSKAFSVHSEIDKSRHAFRRRVLDQAFSESALSDAQSFILEDVKTWVVCLGADIEKRGWTVARNMKDWCNWLGFDMMGDLTFGKSFGCVTKGEHRFVPDVVMDSTKFVYVAGFWPFISLIRPLFGTIWMSLFSTKNAKENDAYIKYAIALMEERMAAENQETDEKSATKPAKRKDFIHFLLHARDPETGRGLSIHELHADSALLIHAGSDTTALTLSSTTFYLVHNEAVLSILQAQIRRTFPTLDSIRSGPELTSLTYLRACIDEAMRMAPPVPSHLPREVMAGGIEIDGHYFPKGTVVGVAPWTIHHNAAYYPDPFTYNPDRWIVSEGEGKDKEESVALARAAFCPFGIGPRGCAGKRLAYLELSLALATLLWVYDLKLDSSTGTSRLPTKKKTRCAEVRNRADVYQLWDHFVADREGPVIHLKKRADVDL